MISGVKYIVKRVIGSSGDACSGRRMSHPKPGKFIGLKASLEAGSGGAFERKVHLSVGSGTVFSYIVSLLI